MAYPGNPPLPNPVAVIAPHFCAPYTVDLTIMKKVVPLGKSTFVVLDVNGKLIFKVKGSAISIRDPLILVDASNNLLISFQQERLAVRRSWQVSGGEGKYLNDILFSVKKSSMKTHLDVFLMSSNNTNHNVPDFTIKGSWLERSCIIYSGESNNIVAQMHKKQSVVEKSTVMGKEDSFMVTVYPNIDYAFIVSLVVILCEINEDKSWDD